MKTVRTSRGRTPAVFDAIAGTPASLPHVSDELAPAPADAAYQRPRQSRFDRYGESGCHPPSRTGNSGA
jgi:hypothetical protein